MAAVAEATVEVLSLGERPLRHGLRLRTRMVVTGDDVAGTVVSGLAICDDGLHRVRSVRIIPDPPGVGRAFRKTSPRGQRGRRCHSADDARPRKSRR